jgi:hypothetical protein
MEMLQSIRFCFNIMLATLGGLGIGMVAVFGPVWTEQMNVIIFLMVCVIALVYGLNNSEYNEVE